jgi:hypothetical protein
MILIITWIYFTINDPLKKELWFYSSGRQHDLLLGPNWMLFKLYRATKIGILIKISHQFSSYEYFIMKTVMRII